MVDANLLKQLEDSLSSYQETQETLDIVVQNAQFAFGEEWMEKLPTAFDNAQIDMPAKIILKDKANHVVHYYGALAAWQEASTYLSDSTTTTAESLAERIPTLEYWLALFGNEGMELVSKVKSLYRQLFQQSDSIEKKDTLNNLNFSPIPEETTSEKNVVQSLNEHMPQTTDYAILSEQNLQEKQSTEIASPEISVRQEQKETTDIQIMPETFRQPDPKVLSAEENTVQSVLQEQTETIDVQHEETIPVETIAPPVWQDRNTDGELTLEELVDFDSISQKKLSLPTEEIINAQEVMEGSSLIVSQNWDLASFLRQKRLFDDANNWLSAWCIRMDNLEKTDYPHYGFIVDIMHDLKEKIQVVLENQLLEEVVEREIPGGKESMERLLSAIDKELEDLPDDFKMSTTEKIKLNAREVLGAIDESKETEFIGPAPDGFELMDDPYAASAEQILSDFEKTEEEAQNQIDKLNVIEDNENKQEKD